MLSSAFCWADVTLTDQEFSELSTKLENSEKALTKALSLLGLSPEELESLRMLDERVQKLLTQSKEHEEKLNQLLEKSETHETSLKELKSGGILGVEAGTYFAFEKPGIYAGVSFEF